MKVISVKQPWATLIVEGVKDIENRTWQANYRGTVLIHASGLKWNWRKVMEYLSTIAKVILSKKGYDENWLKLLPTGCIIGSVQITDCVVNHSSPWAEKTYWNKLYNQYAINQKPVYNWVLENAVKFNNPIPAKGKLSFWEFDMDAKTEF